MKTVVIHGRCNHHVRTAYTIITLLVILLPLSISAYIITGKITDKQTNAPVDSVTVSLETNPLVTTSSKADGTYSLNTNLTAIIPIPVTNWNPAMLFNTMKHLSPQTTFSVHNTRGLLLRTIPLAEARSLNHLFATLPTGLYIMSVHTGQSSYTFRICKASELFVQAEMVQKQYNMPSIGLSAPFQNELTLSYKKNGYAAQTKKVSGDQENVNMIMERVAFCGNKFIDKGELCDGNSKDCNLVDPLKYASGKAACSDSCNRFKNEACSAHPITDVSGNPNGKSHWTALEITAKAQINIIKRVRAGLIEGDMQTIIDSVYKANSFSGLAFPHITGSGPNSLDLHYAGKTRKMVDGDLLLVDIGAKFNGYCADITRTYPVSGKFTPRQREVYLLVMEVLKASAAAMKPNVQSLSQMSTFAKEQFKKSPLRAKDKSGVERTMEVFFIHSLSHYVGKQVHGEDLGLSTSSPVKPGQVFTIEPGLYLDSEKFGIRLEDTFIMTQNGAVSIFPSIPIAPDHIEALMTDRPTPPATSYPEQITTILTDAPDEGRHMNF